jgi:hypothetical protein
LLTTFPPGISPPGTHPKDANHMPNFQGHEKIKEATYSDYRTRYLRLLALKKLAIVKV